MCNEGREWGRQRKEPVDDGIIMLAVYPVLLGTGKRFIADGTPPRSFELISTQAFPSGIIFATYKGGGALKAG